MLSGLRVTDMLAYSLVLLSWLAGRFRDRVELELEVIALPPPTGSATSPASWSPSALRARSSILDLALPGLAAVLERHGIGEAGDRSPLAPSRLPALLALALKVWTAVSRSRSS
jgi:hypothetical protein